MSTGLVVLAVVVLAALSFGVYRRRSDGRMQARVGLVSPDQIGGPLGDRATLLQFSSSFCAPCRTTHRILADVADTVMGVRHVEVNVEDNLDLVRQFDIRRTPTVLVLDSEGGIVRRAVGQPRKADVIAALGEAIPAAG